MTVRRSVCDWDARFVRCEETAGDGVVDRVVYEPVDGSPETATVLVREAIAARRRWWSWTFLGIGFLVGVLVSQATVAMTQTL